jgi:putative two-component system response regulator
MDDRVLIVDDEPNVLDAARRLFRAEPIAVETAASAAEGMEIVSRQGVSVIISDNRMPDMMGVQFLEWAKTAVPDSVRILMTGCADMDAAIGAINRGEVYRFITKPWDGAELKKTVFDSINRYRVLTAMKSSDESKLLSLAQTIELKDPYTNGHCARVAGYALRIAEALGLPEETRRNIKYGCWLHDCGKIGVPESILNKPGALDADQQATMRNHPRWGADVAKTARLHEVVVNIVLYHHERYDGKGYPAGLAGPAIPLESRIVAIADCYDALTTDRPYRNGLSHDESIAVLRKDMAGSLDPGLTELFIGTFPRMPT